MSPCNITIQIFDSPQLVDNRQLLGIELLTSITVLDLLSRVRYISAT